MRLLQFFEALDVGKQIKSAGMKGFAGNCFQAAIDINNRFFNGEGDYVLAYNKAFMKYGQLYGHAAVLHDGVYWDSDGQPKDVHDIESWGMMDEDDPDYIKQAADLGFVWDENTAYDAAVEIVDEKTLRQHCPVNEAYNPDVKVKYFSKNDVYFAYLGRKKVGHAQLYNYKDEKVGENERYVWKSAVQPEYKRQGVATALYDAIAKDLESKGMKLVPSPDQQLSQEAYEFWKARDPKSVKYHGKTLAEPYERFTGQQITAKNRPAVITKALVSLSSVPYFQFRYTDVPEGSTNSVGTATIDSLKDQLQLPESKISTGMRLLEFFKITESMNFYPSAEKKPKHWSSVFPMKWTNELDRDKVDWERYHGSDYEYEPPQNPEYRPDLDLNLSNANMAYLLGDVLGFERDDGFHVPIDMFLSKAQIWLQKNMGQTTPELPSQEEPREFKRSVATDPETGVPSISGGHVGPRMISGGRREAYDETTIMRMVKIASLGKEMGATHVSAF